LLVFENTTSNGNLLSNLNEKQTGTIMTSHERCINCNQRKTGSEYTINCPTRPNYGHEWKNYSGNGIGWSESLVGKLVNGLWATKIGKIIVVIGAILLLKILLK
jgi:hypothetical protein